VAFDLDQLAWVPARASLRVRPFDTDQLADALDALAQDDARRARMGRAGRVAATDHSWDLIVDRYRELINGPRYVTTP
jgi:glycosyltransferase involved in cell wall biosynthesis